MFAKLTETFSGQLIILACVYTLVLVVVFLDLWSGIRKATLRRELRSSYGLRKTVEKLARYFNLLLVLTVIDAMQMLAIHQLNAQISFEIPLMPLLTFCGAIFIGIIECKSIYEKAADKDKGKYQDAARLAKQILGSKDAHGVL